jgi:putative hemolysin
MDSLLLLCSSMLAGILGIGIIAAIETALVGLPTARVQAAIVSQISGARLLTFWLHRPGQVLSTLSLLRTAVTLALGMGVWMTVERRPLSLPQAWAFAALTLTGITCSHLLLRSLAKRFVVEFASKTMWLTIALTLLLWPVVFPLAILGRWVAKRLRVAVELSTPFWTPDEIGRLATDAHAASLGERGEDLFLSIIEFSDTVIREIMVPRTEMVTVPLQANRPDVQQAVLDAGHSRVPVYDDTIDHIVGILHVKDLFISQLRADKKGEPPAFSLQHMLRPTFYVPEVMKISELLREFQRRKTHMAIVVDEYGGTAGVVTLEDIIEEIVGEIHDEYDVEEKQFRVVGDKIIADGRVSIWDLEDALSVEFPDDADYETLAGFLMSRIGVLPEKGTVIEWKALRFIIKEANEKRVGMVEIERLSGGSVTA